MDKPRGASHRDQHTHRERLPSLDLGDLPPDLLGVARRYATQPVPRPTAEQTTRLVARLLAEEPTMAQSEPRRGMSVLLALRVARWRIRLLGAWFWIASVLLIALGAVIAWAAATNGKALALILVVPLTGVMSLAYAIRTTSSGLREVEATTPVGLVEVTAGLALVILGFDCAFGILATLVFALIHWAPFVALLVAWLGPLLLLTGLSLPLALRWGLPAALAVGAGPWVALGLAALLWPHGFPALLFAPPADQLSLALHLVAATTGACLLLLLLLRGSAWQRFLVAIAASPIL